ncbi:hypothetical protein ACNJ7E_41900 [Rhodococcus sp. NM-2]|uniref:hypothetical protein n=1 Tax=Rhodococcus TaxID=1827 RepID=UPI0012F8D4B9|nr:MULTISPECIES: hypothetical protein [Rhodococcus]QQZ19506.1 hypothetical protein GO592_43320 [Rhodococcus sp. 21391]
MQQRADVGRSATALRAARASLAGEPAASNRAETPGTDAGQLVRVDRYDLGVHS